MAKQPNRRGIIRRFRELLATLDRLLNPRQPAPARVPARNR